MVRTPPGRASDSGIFGPSPNTDRCCWWCRIPGPFGDGAQGGARRVMSENVVLTGGWRPDDRHGYAIVTQ